MHPQTMTNTESMLLRHQSNASSFFILEMPPPSFKVFQNRHTQKFKSLYNKQQQLLNACLTEPNPTPKKAPPPEEKPKQNTQQFLNSHYFLTTTVCTAAATGSKVVSSSTTKQYEGTEEEEEEEEEVRGFFKGS